MGRRNVVGVVEDDASVRGALLRLFRASGLEVSLFGTAEEYLADSRRAVVDCLVIDARLPGMGGVDLLERVRAEGPTPALVITAKEDERTRSRAAAAGAVGFFLKPFDNRLLVAAVVQALGLGGPEAGQRS